MSEGIWARIAQNLPRTVLAAMDLTVSDAVRLILTRVAREKALPFEPLVPDAPALAAVKEARESASTAKGKRAPL